VIPAQCPAPHCIDENRQVPRVPLPSVGIALAGGCKLHPCEDVTPRSSLIRTHSPIPFASSCLRLLASYKKSSQVATSPCCQRDLPDVISANPSSDAWSLATAVPRSAFTCFFLRVIGLPHEVSGSASRNSPRIRLLTVAIFDAADIPLCSGLLSLLVPQVVPTAANVPQGSRDFYIRAERALLPLHAPDMLAVRIQVIDGARTFTLQDSQPCRLLPLHLLKTPDILCASMRRSKKSRPTWRPF
jgi:hypothetical protein